MKRLLAASLVFVCCAALASTAATPATLSNESVTSTPADMGIGNNDISISFDMRNESAKPIATLAFQCDLHLPDRTMSVGTEKASYTFQHVVKPGETRHEDLSVNAYSPFGEAAQNIIKGETIACRVLSVQFADGTTALASASPAVASSVR